MTTSRGLTLALTALLTATPAFAAGQRGAPPTQPVAAVQPVTVALTATETATLLFMREE